MFETPQTWLFEIPSELKVSVPPAWVGIGSMPIVGRPSVPCELSPQRNAVEVRSPAMLAYDSAMLVQSVDSPSCIGVVPYCSTAGLSGLLPQHHSAPPVSIAQVLAKPSATVRYIPVPTRVGVAAGVVAPLPRP